MHRDKIRLYIFYIGIILTIIGLPFSRALISFGQVVLGALFIFDVNLVSKLKIFIKDKAALSFIAIYLLWIVGILYSSDIQYALSDIRTKLPLLIFPLVFATEKPLSKNEFTFFAILFSATVIASVSTSLYIYYVNNLSDYRDAFVFVSHIRVSLMAMISTTILIFIGLYRNDIKMKIRIFMLIGGLFLIASQFIFSILSGIFIFLVLLFVVFIMLIYKKVNIKSIVISLSVLIVFVVSMSYLLFSTIKDYNYVGDIDLNKLDTVSALGNKYEHKPYEFQIENGNYIGIYIQRYEMNQEWSKRSNLAFDGVDNRDQVLQITLIRYLNSKGLRKDAQGISALSDEDIINIENGIANFEFAKRLSFKKRIYRLIWQYNIYIQNKESLNSGHTILQRLELWQVGMELIALNPVFGIGTGDINNAYADILSQRSSSLAGNGLRSHNQYISTTVSLGAIGLVILLFSMYYPAYLSGLYYNPLFVLFIVIMSMSMLWEDTIESQVGVTIYAFVYMFYMYSDRSEK